MSDGGREGGEFWTSRRWLRCDMKVQSQRSVCSPQAASVKYGGRRRRRSEGREMAKGGGGGGGAAHWSAHFNVN